MAFRVDRNGRKNFCFKREFSLQGKNDFLMPPFIYLPKKLLALVTGRGHLYGSSITAYNIYTIPKIWDAAFARPDVPKYTICVGTSPGTKDRHKELPAYAS